MNGISLQSEQDFSVKGKCLPAIKIINNIFLPNVEDRVEISTPEDLEAIKESEKEFDNKILLVFPKNTGIENDFESIAVLSTVGIKVSLSNNTSKVRLKPIERVELDGLVHSKNFLVYKYKDFYPPYEEPEELDITFNYLVKTIEDANEIISIFKSSKDEAAKYEQNKTNYVLFIDYVASKIKISVAQKKEILLEKSPLKRMTILMQFINRRGFVKDLEQKIEEEVHKSMDKQQKEYYLREKMKAIQVELGDRAKKDEEIESMRAKLNAKNMPADIKARALVELNRYASTSSQSPDGNVSKNYLDLIIDLPWNTYSEDEMSLKKVKEVLDEDHFGLDKVKQRILEFISVNIKTKKNSKTILCLYGPPGVGKTSLGKSIARALGKKFVKTSLGGVSDEAEIRGHRRTYVSALPGRILKSIKEAGTSNPLFLIDEIDKLSHANHGDPASAMLEVLDPEQNYAFIDNYLDEPYDLSKVFFVATANYLDHIPEPLRDRIELIELSSYTEYEKLQIAKTHLIPNQLKANNMTDEEFQISDEVVLEIIQKFTMESGVRELQRVIESLIRKAIKECLIDDKQNIVIDHNKLIEYLGKEKFTFNETDKEDQIGVVTGLAYTQYGGDTMPIEVVMYPGKGDVVLTGKLGEVMQESARTALSYVRSNATEFEINPEVFNTNSFHIHVPEGATPKDGPSAGVTLATAIYSALTKHKVSSQIGMTGEITLRGKVLPIGGLREKSIAAVRSGLKTIFIPKENLKDLDEIPEEVKQKLTIIPVSYVIEILKSGHIK